MKHLPRLFIFFLISLEVQNSYGAAQIDSTNTGDYAMEIQLKRFDQGIINKFKGGDEFIYEQPPEARPNLLKLLFQKLFQWLVMVFGNEGFAWLVLILLIIVGVVGLGFAFYGIFGIGKSIPIYSKDFGELDYSVKDENIHELNFVDEIDMAVEQKDYKRAIRLVYLYALKLLSDQKIIEWRPSKTNHDYLYEIQNYGFQQQFSTLSYYFEYVWYGDFQAEETQFREMKAAFSGLKLNLQENDKS